MEVFHFKKANSKSIQRQIQFKRYGIIVSANKRDQIDICICTYTNFSFMSQFYRQHHIIFHATIAMNSTTVKKDMVV